MGTYLTVKSPTHRGLFILSKLEIKGLSGTACRESAADPLAPFDTDTTVVAGQPSSKHSQANGKNGWSELPHVHFYAPACCQQFVHG